MGLALAQSQFETMIATCRYHHVARPNYHPGKSNIDLLVEFQRCEPGTFCRTYSNLLSELRKSLSVAVDLVMVDTIRNPYIKATIKTSKQEIYAA